MHQSTSQPIQLQLPGNQNVRFDLDPLTRDAGLPLIALIDQRIGLTESLAPILLDRRDPDRVAHTTLDLIRQRVYGIVRAMRTPTTLAICGAIPPSSSSSAAASTNPGRIWSASPLSAALKPASTTRASTACTVPCSRTGSNALRLILHVVAYRLCRALLAALKGTVGETWQFDTMRLRLLKIPGDGIQQARKVLIRMPRRYPHQDLWSRLAGFLGPLAPALS